jgi:hypothetical protein
MDTITRGALTFSAALVLFDAIPTDWVSKHYSVGLQILLQASKCTIDAENVDAPLVMVSIGARKKTLAGQTVYKNRAINASFALCFH